MVLPACETGAMQLHTDEFSNQFASSAHAILLLDQAGWRIARALAVPKNITAMRLPPRSPELNPIENICQHIRQNWLSNRVFRAYDDIMEICCEPWHKLIDRPWAIMSIDRRRWATISQHQ